MIASGPSFLLPIFCGLSREPLSIFLGFLALILARDLLASPADLALLSATKAIAPVLGFFCSFLLTRTIDAGPKALVFVGLLARLPVLVLPFISDSPKTIILVTFCYVLAIRSIRPYWVDLIRLLYGENRVDCFVYMQRVTYTLSILLGPVFGWILDRQWLKGTQILSLLSLWSLVSVGVKFYLGKQAETKRTSHHSALSIKDTLLLLRTKHLLLRFHLIYFFVGSAMNILNVWLPSFLAPFKETLCYTKLLSIIVVGKCLGSWFVLCFVKDWLKKNLFFALRKIIFIACCQLYLLYVVMSGCKDSWFAWLLIYCGSGMIFAGGNLIWESSATLFGQNDSRAYSQLNLCMLGLRGILAPLCIRFLLQKSELVYWLCVIASFYVIGLVLSLLPSVEVEKHLSFAKKNSHEE